MTTHILPVPDWCVETQSFLEHEARAKKMGCCSRPGSGCACYYYGGMDLAPPWSRVGEAIPVVASAAGMVLLQNQGAIGYGIHYRLTTDDGELAIFGHLERGLVSNGKQVGQGEQLGWMGNTGNSTGKHLHWEIRVAGVPVDPRTKIGEASHEEYALPESWPKLPKFRVDCDLPLAVRLTPSVYSNMAHARLNKGTIIEVLENKLVGGNTWLRIGLDQWVAGYYQGHEFVKWNAE